MRESFAGDSPVSFSKEIARELFYDTLLKELFRHKLTTLF